MGGKGLQPGSLAALSAPSRAYGPDLVSFATSCMQGLAGSEAVVLSGCLLDEDTLCALHSPGCPDPAPGAPHLDSICLCIRGHRQWQMLTLKKAVVPAAHATRVPGDLWSDRKGRWAGPPLGRPGRCPLPGCWARASGTACHPPLHHRVRLAGEGTYRRAPCVIPGFKAAGLAVQSRTPGALLGKGTMVFPLTSQFPLQSKQQRATRTWRWPWQGQALLPAGPCQFLPAPPGSQGAG